MLSSRLKTHLRASRSSAKCCFLRQDADLAKPQKDTCEDWSKKRLFPDRKLLVLDLDETLVHSYDAPAGGDFQLKVTSTETCFEIGFSLRPFVRDFLEKASQLYEVVVFTSSLAAYANAVLDFIDPRQRLVHHRLYRQHCTLHEGVLCKDLGFFSGVSLKQILICDNIISNFRLHLDNGVPVTSWTGEKEDQELIYLMDYLGKVSSVEDVREVNRQLFQLEAALGRSEKIRLN